MDKQCCKDMQVNIDSDTGIVYIPKFREYGIAIDNGGSSIQMINFCPWCGHKLPKSLRDQWFDIVDNELGLEIFDDDVVPEEMKTSAWWGNKGL